MTTRPTVPPRLAPATPRLAPAAPLSPGRDVLARLTMLAAVLGTAVTLHGVVDGWRWWAELAALLGLVTALGFILARVLPESVVVCLELVGLLLGLNAFYAGAQSLLGVVPTAQSVAHLVDLVGEDAMSSIASAAPAPATPGMRLVIVGVVAAVWCFVRITGMALRLPALAGTGLLMVYVLPSTLAPDGVPWWCFVPGALGFLGLLAVDQQERLRAWGPRIGMPAGAASTVVQPVAGLLVAATAVTLAVVIPAQVEGMERQQTPTFDELMRSGDQTITVVNPIQSLSQDLNSPSDAPVLTYRTAERQPGPLRLGTVDVFDGQTWAPTYGRISRRNDVGDGLPRPPGLGPDVTTRTVTTEFTIDTLQQNWLTVPYPASRVQIDGEWLYDPATFNITGPGSRPGQQYSVDSLVVEATQGQLRAAPAAGPDFDRWRQLPALPDSVLVKADEVAGTGSDFEKASALQAWLREDGGFTYSLQAPPESGSSAIEDFLIERRGYCVHFASTMAVMARAEGIPARVAVGFLPGEQIGQGVWQVTQRDAHAWPELYFEGVGWVAFEPTPSGRTGQAPPVTQPSPTATPSPTPTPTEETSASPAAAPAPVPAEAGRPAALLWIPAVAVLALAVLTAAALVRRRRRQQVATPEHAWTELTSRLGALGVPAPPTRTLRQTRDSWVEELADDDQAVGSLDRLVSAVEESRYAPGGLATAVRPRVRADVDRVVQAFEVGRPWWRRLWSRWR